MTGSDLSAVLVCLVVGYVVASWLISRRSPPGPGSAGSAPGPDRATPPPAPWHEVLGVSATASLDEIRLAYRRLIGEYHPDRTGHLGETSRALAEERSKAINAAYDEARSARGERTQRTF